MTEVLRSPSSSSTPPHNAAFFQHTQSGEGISGLRDDGDEDENEAREKRENDRRDQLSVLAVFVTVVRKSFWLTCKTVRDSFPDDRAGGGGGRNCGGGVTEIGWPTDVQHVNHVTFDRFDGFLGLPDEFEPEVPRRAPSASATVFGVSTESMQLSYDHRGNSIPTILLLLQRHLYSQGGLRAEGIFRITAGNSQDEYVRDQLSRGVVPQGIDVHCLAGLIKAWFRELPRGVLDSLSPEQVMQCESEEDCDALVRLLPPSEVALLDWAINLMADVVQQEHLNKMNARNIAMVFAPNMTQMDDPLIALMYTVQVMNFLKTLTEKILRERQDSVLESTLAPDVEPFDDDGRQSISELHQENPDESKEETMQAFVVEDPGTDSGSEANQVGTMSDEDYLSSSSFTEESDESGYCGTPSEVYGVALPKPINILWNQFVVDSKRSSNSQSNESNPTKHESRTDDQPPAGLAVKIDNLSLGISNLCRINSMPERFEAWC